MDGSIMKMETERVKRDGMKIYNVREKPFTIYGLYKPETEGKFRRLPAEVAKKMSVGAFFHHSNTSGGRIRFRTDSDYVALKAIFPANDIMDMMPLTGSSGFDLYADKKYIRTFQAPITYVDDCRPRFDVSHGYEDIIEFKEKNVMRDIIINFPPYNDVSDVYIGLAQGAQAVEGGRYPNDKPVVFYGSSITQGAAASRPGNTYENILSRRLDFDYISLGFSGNARAEDIIAEYISDLEMKVFFYDYDHNAPDPAYLRETHAKMFKKIRAKHPHIPIIMASRPAPQNGETDTAERIEVIRKTYEEAKANGDNNVYFVNGMDVFNSIDPEMMTVDGCHPNDFGFHCMATEFAKVLQPLLQKP